MAKFDRHNAKRSNQEHLGELLGQAQDRLPGVLEMLQVYGGYEQLSATIASYLEPTRPHPFISTSNQSAPIS